MIITYWDHETSLIVENLTESTRTMICDWQLIAVLSNSIQCELKFNVPLLPMNVFAHQGNSCVLIIASTDEWPLYYTVYFTCQKKTKQNKHDRQCINADPQFKLSLSFLFLVLSFTNMFNVLRRIKL